jgi:long-chain acyl-CoA synthetase
VFELFMAIAQAGWYLVPINWHLTAPEIAYILRDSGAKAFVASPRFADAARAAADEAELPVSSRFALGDVPGFRAYSELKQDQPRSLPADRAAGGPMTYTSGTTGHPKGAELTHENMLLNAVATRDMYLPAMRGGYEQDVALVTLPLFHSTAQTCLMNAGLLGGFRLVLLPRFDPAVVLETMRREEVSFWIGVPTMYWALLAHVRQQQVDPAPIAKHLRLCVSGGAAMPHEVMRNFEAVFGARIVEGYGLSETSPVACFNQLHRPTKPGTVGQPVFGVEVRCVDDEHRFLPTGERGEIVIRGPNVMKGYYSRPEATEEAMRHGWFHTGDIGTIDTDGYLTIVDRKKDMIIRGGFNVYPREIEEVMLTHPSVSLVAVIGIPDERLGEEVKAFVVRKPQAAVTEGELMGWCREQMAAYKYPRHIEFREALPVSATGKILKRELKSPP